MDKMREEFEVFASKMGLDLSYVIGDCCEFVEYFDYYANVSWMAWKASREITSSSLESAELQNRNLIVALKTAKGFIEQAIEVGGFGEYTLGVVNHALRKAEGYTK